MSMDFILTAEGRRGAMWPDMQLGDIAVDTLLIVDDRLYGGRMHL